MARGACWGPEPTWVHAVVLWICTALGSVGAALMTNFHCEGDDTFMLSDPAARPSGYCKLTHFPGLPDTVGSALVVVGIFGAPMVVALVGFGVARRKRSAAVLGAVTIAVVLLVLACWFIVPLAHVGYAGEG